MRVTNREEAARLLAERLANYEAQRPLVLGVPRGAVPMAGIIATALHGELDVVLVGKLRAPGQPHLTIGAVAEGGLVLKGPYASYVPADHLREEVRTQQEILRTRRELYTTGRPGIDPAGRVVIIVDDGIVTGSTMLAAIRAVRAHRPKRVIVAIAVAPADVLSVIRRETDDVVCVHAARDLGAVAEYFEDFSEVTDGMVIATLETASRAASPQPT